jgi:hypothetical protein
LARHEGALRDKVDRLVATRRPAEYDEAVRLLLDLRDAAAATGSNGVRLRLDGLPSRHGRTVTLIAQLKRAVL